MTDHPMFEVCFRDIAPDGYARTILCLGVPRMGEDVMVDGLCGQVWSVVWNVTSGKPNGRSVTVFVKAFK